MPNHHLVIGTTNAAKGRELSELLAPHGYEVRTLKDFPPLAEVVEDGATFAENARKKAIEYARQLKCCVLTDDSGLCVDALEGRPGVYSARYAGANAADDDNNARLLEELGALPPARRGAHYECHVAVADAHGAIQAESFGVCRGRITTAPAGANGFGYDPLFEVIEYHETFGQLGSRVKAALSHRARALRAIVPKLLDLARRGGCNG